LDSLVVYDRLEALPQPTKVIATAIVEYCIYSAYKHFGTTPKAATISGLAASFSVMAATRTKRREQ